MIELTKKFSASDGAVHETLELTFEARQKRWLRTRLSSGEEVALRLPRGEKLRDGDLFLASDGRVVAIAAAPERVIHIECPTASDLLRVAYHLGNRHVAVQVGVSFLRIQENPGVEDMARGLGATVIAMEAPFEPESGAYAKAHSHIDDASATIHEYSSNELASTQNSERRLK